MTLVQCPTIFTLPTADGINNNAPSFSDVSLSSSGYKTAVIVTAPITDTISKIGFRTGAINAGDLDVRIETVDLATGFPTGTLWGTNTNYVLTLAGTEDNTFIEVTLTSGASMNAGDLFAIVLESKSASLGSFSYQWGGALTSALSMPYPANNTGSWARGGGYIRTSVYFSGAGYVPIAYFCPASAVNTHTFNNTSTPDVYGNAITPAFNCKVNGVWVLADIDGNFTAKLYDTDGVTVLASADNDADIPSSTGVTSNFIYLNAEVSLTAGSKYFLGIEPSSATSMSVYSVDFLDTDIKKNYVDSSVEYITAKDPSGVGSWTTTTTRVLLAGLNISQIDNGAGGGGGGGLAANPLIGALG